MKFVDPLLAMNLAYFSHSIFSFPLRNRGSLDSLSPKRFSCRSAVMSTGNFMEFPYVSGPHRNLMVELLSTVEDRLGSSLRPCTLPSDVQQFENASGTARASLNLRSGLPSSQQDLLQNVEYSFPNYIPNKILKPNKYQIDFVLGSWIHCELPSGGALNITSLSAYLRPLTDAPHFLMELIQSSPTSLVLVLDLTPRKDPIMYPEYLKTYYEDTQLDRHRQRLQKLPEVRPYVSPSLYIRAVLSPTAIIASIDVGASETSIDDIIRDHVDPITKELLQFWLDSCACLERHVGEQEKAYLAERDRVIKNQTIEVDLGSNFPRLFGLDVAERTLGVLKEYYNK